MSDAPPPPQPMVDADTEGFWAATERGEDLSAYVTLVRAGFMRGTGICCACSRHLLSPFLRCDDFRNASRGTAITHRCSHVVLRPRFVSGPENGEDVMPAAVLFHTKADAASLVVPRFVPGRPVDAFGILEGFADLVTVDVHVECPVDRVLRHRERLQDASNERRRAGPRGMRTRPLGGWGELLDIRHASRVQKSSSSGETVFSSPIGGHRLKAA